MPTAAALTLPQHTLRLPLNDELHARPPVTLADPTWITHLVMLHESPAGTAERVASLDEERHLQALCALARGPFESQKHGNHWILEAGGLSLKWERHNEFSSYTFFRRREASDSDQATALEAFPPDWCMAIPGQLLVASHVEYCTPRQRDIDALLDEAGSARVTTIASRVAGGDSLIVSDFRLHDGYTRLIVVDESGNARQAGVTVQQLLEIETYRIMALLSFPVAREVSQRLGRAEQEAAQLMAEMAGEQGHENERAILARLTRLAADVELSVSRTAYRFGAAEAYYAIVRQRLDDLAEQRIGRLPTVRSFMDRRLAPAMQTCLSASKRQSELSSRIARNSALLRTRVEIELERQNQELLTQLNRRARVQLRLQETVEGLSVVAITYYATQLVHHLAVGAEERFHAMSPEIVTALAIPVIGGLVYWGLRRMRRSLTAIQGDA
jgi:uncharacterized membrane-anchored protein